MKKKEQPQISVPDDLVGQWQGLVNTMAELAGIPAGLIMRIEKKDIEVFVASHSRGNPYSPGDREHLASSGLYCETVIDTKQPLLIPDALSDPEWKDNPDVKLSMISYLGYPILFPDDTPFGTLCILDNKANAYSDTICNLLDNFRHLIQQHLALLHMNAVLGEKNTNLMEYLDELQFLRGLIPICAQCKKIKDSRGYWKAVEKYLINHPEASFTHGYCPECYKKAMDEIKDF
jgi:GAF domain-containing protein